MSDLSIAKIRGLVADCSIGQDLRYLPVVDSTNRIIADLCPGDWSSGTVILANFQEAGRGRSGRSWLAPPGTSVMLSIIFQRLASVAPADYVMLAALAARDAIARAAGIEVQLKWPNDVLIGDKKVAGILGESSQQRGIERLILGVGMNVNFGDSHRDTLPETATSLDFEVGRVLDRDELAAALIRSFDLWYRSLTHRPDDIFDVWSAALDIAGLPVSIQDSGTAWSGTALGVQRDGGLLVETDDGEVRCVYAADVSVRRRGGSFAP